MGYSNRRVQIKLEGKEAEKFLEALSMYEKMRGVASRKDFVMYLVDTWFELMRLIKDIKRMKKLIEFLEMINKMKQLSVELKEEGLMDAAIVLVTKLEEGLKREDKR